MSAELVKTLYASMPDRLARARRAFGRPLTLAEKIFVAHCHDFEHQTWERGKAILKLRVDRVGLQDATAQMALLQFMQSGRKRVAVPTTSHCDHLIRAESGAGDDLNRALGENREVYDFLRSASRKFGIGFWRPGAGIIHQVVLENYAFPGGLMIGADSHTPNGGGLGMMAIGVGGADCAEVMAGLPWEVLQPRLVGVHLTGKLSGWTAPKDVITYLCTLLTVKGGTNKIIEYFGPGTESISATGKGTICNMGAELGATTSIFPYDSRMAAYLRATDRADIAALADAARDHLVADPEVEGNPSAFYDEIVEINLDELEPHVVGPHSPDRGRPISRLGADVRANGWPNRITNALIGSCTNSSYEDMRRAAHIAQQGIKAGLRAKVPFLITPGSERIYQTIKRDGIIDVFQQIGGTVLANACGPCIGQWKRSDVKADEANAIVSSFNRNFPGRNDGSAATLSFISSPDIVTALAFAGTLEFDPVHGTLPGPDGKAVRFTAPEGEELPRDGFARGAEGFEEPADDPDSVEIIVPANSERLQLLGPFLAWDGVDFVDLPILVKTKGKTTTDHISPAGPWLRFRGHLDRISDNMFMGAVNAFTGDTGKGVNPVTGAVGAVMTSDAAEFKEAVDRGEYERALGLYGGPLLEDFHLRDSPEFERWRETERKRLASDLIRVAGSLATRAAEVGEHERAADLWRRALAADPLDTRTTLGLMEALAAAGDRSGALGQARVHELLRRQEQARHPDPAVVALAERLSAETSRASRPEPSLPTEPRADPSLRNGVPRRRIVAWWVPAAALGMTIVLGVVGRLGRRQREADRLDPDLLVVAPYQVLDPALQLWREGLVDVLSRHIDGAGPLRTVAPSTALRRWHGHADQATAAELGRNTGAGFAVVGSVLRAGGDSVRVTATVVESASGRVVCEVERREAILRMDRLIDSLVLALLRELERRRHTGVEPPASLAPATSLEALKAFLRGEQFYRRSRWDSALVYYQHAVAHDSTFALAVRRLGQVLGWQRLTVDSVSLGHLLRAGALNHGLSPRDSLLVAADSLLAAASLATNALAEWGHTRRLFATLRDAVRRYPEAPGAWLALGDAGYHFGMGPAVGVPEREQLAAFDSAIALDPGFAGAYIHPVELGFNLGGRQLGLRYAQRYLRLDPQEPAHRGVALVVRLVESADNEVARKRMLDTAATEAIVSARTILRRWPDSAETAVLLSRVLAEGRPSSYPLFSDTAFMRRRLAQALAFRGHLHEAARVLGEREAPIFVELAYLGAIPDAAASAVFARWSEDESEYARLALAWWSMRGDTASIAALRRRASRRARGARDSDARVAAGYDTSASSAHLRLASGDTAAALPLFLVLPDTLCAECYLDRLIRGRLLARAGRRREALAAFKEPLAAFLTPMEVVFALERARAAEALGARQEAAGAYRFVREAWARADAELGSSVSDARTGLGRVRQ